LPTEAEWEYACRAGATTPFHFGSQLNGREANCCGIYPYGTTEKGPFLQRTTTVGSYTPNAFGLFDMHGNVWEWCQDWYDGDYYKSSPVDDPKGPEKASARVFRGGCWAPDGAFCRAAARGLQKPSFRLSGLGFRVAAVPPGK
jgi:formylglycine-generating enzyme required for sulfatase activity